ncbi:glycosyltransferase family 4 protein [Venatoribacter cucullus]|nr:glycosyltransferase family 1 protein [Venatoribacter cucullus]
MEITIAERNAGMDAGRMTVNVILNTEAIRSPLTGIGRYSYELAKALQEHPEIDSLRFFASGRFSEALPVAEVLSGDSVSSKEINLGLIKRWVQKSSLAIEVHRRLLGMVRANGLKGYEDNIYHSPNFFLPRFSGPKVATFHDLSPFTWAHCHEPAKVHYLQTELRNTLQNADRLITDSEYTRQELVSFSGISADRIYAVPLAAAPEFHPRPSAQVQPFLQHYGLSYQGYTLFVGTIEPRKNIITLLQAYEQLPLTVRQRWPLVLTGYHGWNSASIHARIKRAEEHGWAKYLGYLSATDLPYIYAGARLFAFPSHYEGFGLPVLEALCSGVPVVCSNSSSLPEVAGGAGLFHLPEDTDTLQQHLQKALEDQQWRDQAISDGLKHALTFSWQRCAEETTHVYKKLAADL